MTVKSIQTLVHDAMQEIKTISADEAYQMFNQDSCNLIDIREINELDNSGRVGGAIHIPRGMLEIYLDPNSVFFQNGQLNQNKEFVLFCAGGVRSALAVKSLKEMGYEKISHVEGGFGSINSSNFKIGSRIQDPGCCCNSTSCWPGGGGGSWCGVGCCGG